LNYAEYRRTHTKKLHKKSGTRAARNKDGTVALDGQGNPIMENYEDLLALEELAELERKKTRRELASKDARIRELTLALSISKSEIVRLPYKHWNATHTIDMKARQNFGGGFQFPLLFLDISLSAVTPVDAPFSTGLLVTQARF